MGKYTLVISVEAKAQIASLYKTGNAALIRKIEQILGELIDHPKTGTGKVEKLKGDLQGYWSRGSTGSIGLFMKLLMKLLRCT